MESRYNGHIMRYPNWIKGKRCNKKCGRTWESATDEVRWRWTREENLKVWNRTPCCALCWKWKIIWDGGGIWLQNRKHLPIQRQFMPHIHGPHVFVLSILFCFFRRYCVCGSAVSKGSMPTYRFLPLRVGIETRQAIHVWSTLMIGVITFASCNLFSVIMLVHSLQAAKLIYRPG